MAKGPHELTQNFKKEVDDFEKTIDSLLEKKSFFGTGKISVNTPRGLNELHFKSLQQRYLRAGWTKVERNFGVQQDPGDWITFESIKPDNFE